VTTGWGDLRGRRHLAEMVPRIAELQAIARSALLAARLNQ
jgi:hypothetical protein